jgi:hypothetical protein
VIRDAMIEKDCFRMRKRATTGGRLRPPWNGRWMRTEFQAGRNICGSQPSSATTRSAICFTRAIAGRCTCPFAAVSTSPTQGIEPSVGSQGDSFNAVSTRKLARASNIQSRSRANTTVQLKRIKARLFAAS